MLYLHIVQVNVGCVPKKLMFHAASHMEEVSDMRDYGIDVKVAEPFDWRYVTITMFRWIT